MGKKHKVDVELKFKLSKKDLNKLDIEKRRHELITAMYGWPPESVGWSMYNQGWANPD